MSSQRVSGTAVQRTIAVLGSAVFFVVAPCTLAGLVPWSITGWQLRPPFLGLELTRGIGASKTMIERTQERFDIKPERLAGDTAYGFRSEPQLACQRQGHRSAHPGDRQVETRGRNL